MDFTDDACDAYGVRPDGSGLLCLTAWQKAKLFDKLLYGDLLTLAERAYVQSGALGSDAQALLPQMLPPVQTVALNPWLVFALMVLGFVAVASAPRR